MTSVPQVEQRKYVYRPNEYLKARYALRAGVEVLLELCYDRVPSCQNENRAMTIARQRLFENLEGAQYELKYTVCIPVCCYNVTVEDKGTPSSHIRWKAFATHSGADTNDKWLINVRRSATRREQFLGLPWPTDPILHATWTKVHEAYAKWWETASYYMYELSRQASDELSRQAFDGTPRKIPPWSEAGTRFWNSILD